MTERELQGLISELRIHYDKLREKVAWLELKHSELQPDDEVSLFGFLDAKQNLAIEKSLLSGHATAGASYLTPSLAVNAEALWVRFRIKHGCSFFVCV